jgi:hypothetical protein
MLRLMGDMLKLIWWVVIGLFRSRASLEAEIVALRHQLNVLRRKSPKRLAFSNFHFCQSLSDFATHCECLGDRKAGDSHPLASRWFSLVLAMEVAISRRQTKGAARNSPIDLGNEFRQSAVGCSPDPRRALQARHRNWPDLGRHADGARLNGSLRRSDTRIGKTAA